MRYQDIQNTICAFIVSFVLCFCSVECFARGSLASDTRLGPGRHTLTLAVAGLTRTYIVHVPPSYDSRTQSPVVLMLHDGGGTAKAAIWKTGWTEKADKAGFLAVFPNAMPRNPSRRSSFARSPQLWNDGSNRFYPDKKAVDDIRFISALLDDLSTRFTLDKRRVFVTGFSNGASMSFLVGAQLSNRITAIAPVAGACWFEPVILKRQVPMLYITGKADPLNPIEGGIPKLATNASDRAWAKPKPPVRESISRWAKALDCPLTPANVSDANGVCTESYGSHQSNAKTVYITVDGLGHVWAGGRSLLPERIVGKTSNLINTTDIIWDFFLKHHGSAEDNDDAQQEASADANKPRD